MNKDQIKNNSFLIYSLFFLWIFIIISDYLKNISYLNSLLSILIFSFPFLFFLLIEFFLKPDSYKILWKIFKLVFFLNIIVSLAQIFYGLRGDFVTGIFYSLGIGAHMNGALCIIFSIVVFYKEKINFRSLFIYLISFLVIIMSDSKQIILAGILSLILYIFANFLKILFRPNLKEIISNLFLLMLLIIMFLISHYLIQNNFIKVYALKNFEILFDGLLQKVSVFNFFELDKNLNLFFGNGSGMTVSKLAYVANTERYENFLSQFNYTFSRLFHDIKFHENTNFLSNPVTGSSLFQLTFYYAGVLGDLGLFGLITITLLYFNIYKKCCNCFFSKIIFFNYITYGLIFSWGEETIFITIIFLSIKLIENWENELYKNSTN